MFGLNAFLQKSLYMIMSYYTAKKMASFSYTFSFFFLAF